VSTCPDCGAESSDRRARFCAACGALLGGSGRRPHDPAPHRGAAGRRLLGGALILGAVAILAGLVVPRFLGGDGTEPVTELTARAVDHPTGTGGGVDDASDGTGRVADDGAGGSGGVAAGPPLIEHWSVSTGGVPDWDWIGRASADSLADAVVVSTGVSLWSFAGSDGGVRWIRRFPGSAHVAQAVGHGLLLADEATDAGTTIHRLDPQDGSTRWARPLGSGRPGLHAAPGTALVTLRDDEGPALLALDAGDGSERWRVPVDGRVTDAGGDLVLVVGPAEENRDEEPGTLVLRGLDLDDGEVRWSRAIGGQGQPQGLVGLDGRFAGQRSIVASAPSGEIVGLDPATGEVRWTVDGSRRGVSFAVVEDLVFLLDEDQRFVALDAATGEMRWRSAVRGVRPDRALIRGDEVLIAHGGALTALGLRDGATRWAGTLDVAGDHQVVGDVLVTVTAPGEVTARALPTASGGDQPETDPDDEVWSLRIPLDAGIALTADPTGVYRASAFGNWLVAHSLADGSVRWSRRSDGWGPAEPVVSRGLIALRRASATSSSGETARDRVILYDIHGELRWDEPGIGAGVHLWSNLDPLAFRNDLVIESGGDRVRARTQQAGEVLWETDLGGELAGTVLAPGVRVDIRGASNARPAAGSGPVVAVERGGVVHAVRASTGEVRWSRDLGDVAVSLPPAADADVVAVAGDGGTVHLLDLGDGEVRWSAETGGAAWSAPVIHGGTVAVIVGGELVALDTEDGSERWRDTPHAPFAGPPAASAAGLHVATTDGDVRVLGPADGSVRGQYLVPARIALGPVVVGEVAHVLTFPGRLHAIGPVGAGAGRGAGRGAELEAPTIDGG
jgi:outer membrane protein assembly factor BamB